MAAAVPTHEGMESHAEVEAESTHTCVQPSTCCRAAPLCRHCQDSSALPDGCSECSCCRKQWVAPPGPASPPPPLSEGSPARRDGEQHLGHRVG